MLGAQRVDHQVEDVQVFSLGERFDVLYRARRTGVPVPAETDIDERREEDEDDDGGGYEPRPAPIEETLCHGGAG